MTEKEVKSILNPIIERLNEPMKKIGAASPAYSAAYEKVSDLNDSIIEFLNNNETEITLKQK